MKRLFLDANNPYWKSVPGLALLGSALAAICFCIYALIQSGEFLFPDNVNLPFHEFGHIFFSIFGETVGLWGGTLMQLIIPFSILAYFFIKRETAGVFFSAFWFGENLLNIGVYINDARALELPLVGGGEHDWNIILGSMKLLRYDHYVAAIVKSLGWFIMLGSIVWFLVRGMRAREEKGKDSFDRVVGVAKSSIRDGSSKHDRYLNRKDK
ncbi:MAG: hypothetical protein HZB62_05230 [Nitrospirae bacterium]|nr:hypothetical protein [Nitrospirota bacterium]